MMANNVFEVEINDTESRATPFRATATESTVLKGTSTSKDDKDYFTFTAATTGPVSVAVTATSNAALEVKTRAGLQLLETEPNNGVNQGTFQSVAGETYYLRMRSTSKSAPSTLLMSRWVPADRPHPALENNGGGDNAILVAILAAQAQATVQIQSPGRINEVEQRQSRAGAAHPLGTDAITLVGAASKKDRDFFHITPTAGGSVQLTASSPSIKVSVETATGIKLLETEPTTASPVAHSCFCRLILRCPRAWPCIDFEQLRSHTEADRRRHCSTTIHRSAHSHSMD